MSETLWTALGVLLIIGLIPGGRDIVHGLVRGAIWLLVFAFTWEQRKAQREAEQRHREERRRAREARAHEEEDDRWPGGQDVDPSMEAVLEELRRQRAEPGYSSVCEELESELRKSDEWHTLTMDAHAGHDEKVRARRRLNKRFHPDRFPSESAVLQKAANRCQQIINEWWERYEARRERNEEGRQ